MGAMTSGDLEFESYLYLDSIVPGANKNGIEVRFCTYYYVEANSSLEMSSNVSTVRSISLAEITYAALKRSNEQAKRTAKNALDDSRRLHRQVQFIVDEASTA